jgi:hypothetical protein
VQVVLTDVQLLFSSMRHELKGHGAVLVCVVLVLYCSVLYYVVFKIVFLKTLLFYDSSRLVCDTPFGE